MTNEHSQSTYDGPPRKFQGRSKKQLRLVVKHDGVVWVARCEGRPTKFFGASRQEATDNLKAGGGC